MTDKLKNLAEAIAAIKSQLEQLAVKEQANQQEQAAINQRVRELETEIQEKNLRQSQLDEEAIQIYSQTESLKLKLDKLERINQLTQEFQSLQSDCQQDSDLLDALYASVAETSTTVVGESLYNPQEPEVDFSDRERDRPTIATIKQNLPNAERIYQQLVTKYLETCKGYQNFLVDGLDLIWCSLAFVAFGRSSYRQMCLKFHPDHKGSDRSMQLINTAWEIARQYTDSESNVKTL